MIEEDRPVNSEAIDSAYQRIQSYLTLPTPVEYSPWLSQRSQAQVYLKLEMFRETRTFKVRGALNFLLQLPEEERNRGVVTASGGNHALAVAYAAQLMGIPCRVVMTARAPQNIAKMCSAYKAIVVIHGDVYEESEARAQEMADTQGQVFMPAFDHPAVIAGQGTIGRELQKQVPECTDVLVPVGGGGLIAGIALSYQDQSIRPRIVGIEPRRASALYHSLKYGQRTELPEPQSQWAEKLMPRAVGELPFQIARHSVDEVVLVDDQAIEKAVVDFLAQSNLLVEGSAAITAAALLEHAAQFAGRRVVLVLSGGNINLPLLAEALPKFT